jgi:hypothetical protein
MPEPRPCGEKAKEEKKKKHMATSFKFTTILTNN